MAGEWRTVRFGDIAQTLPGKYIPASDYDPAGPYLIFGSNSVMGRSRVPLYDGPIIAFARIGSNCGATIFSRGACWINNNAAGIRGKDGCDTRFLFYWMQAFDFAQIREGSGQPYISDRVLKAQLVGLPPLPEQRAIAHILGTLDDKIELNRRMSETLEQMARALFKAWFVDFEPVRAKMDGRWRRGESLPGMPAHLYDLFPDRLVASELGKIPEGWEVGRLGALAEIQGGKQLPTDDCQPSGMFPVYGANGIMGYTNRATHDGFVIAFGRVGTCGSVHWTYSGAWINNNASSVVPKWWPEYVLQAMLEADFEDMRTGSVQPFIPTSSLASLQLLRAPDKVLDAFSRIVRTIRLKQQALQHQSRTLAALRDALLPKLIRGEIRVKDAERFLEERGL